jgi:hypothetical protein
MKKKSEAIPATRREGYEMPTIPHFLDQLSSTWEMSIPGGMSEYLTGYVNYLGSATGDPDVSTFDYIHN